MKLAYSKIVYIETSCLALGAIVGLIMRPGDPERMPTKVALKTDVKVGDTNESIQKMV